MKTKRNLIQICRLVIMLVAGLTLLLDCRVTAQTFTILHNFSGYPSDGNSPQGSLILSGSTLYGTAAYGGPYNSGTVFGINTTGTIYTNLHSFSYNDGEQPWDGLTLSGNTMFGTTFYGGVNGNGTVFAIYNGVSFTNLYNFTATTGISFSTNSDGAYPWGGLILSGNTLFGTAWQGGTNGYGTVFGINTIGTVYTNLHSFTAEAGLNGTNSDGASPFVGLILSGNTLYGTAEYGGAGYGTVFGVNTNGTVFTNLHIFTGGSNGAYPCTKLILSSNTLYGMANGGGSSDNGVVFAVNTDGTGFTNLHSFTAYGYYADIPTNSDGLNPTSLILSGNTLYGMAENGGANGAGTVFAVNTSGTGFTNLHNFTYASDGGRPVGGLLLSGNVLYGTASSGGTNDGGTVFSLTLPTVIMPPQLSLIHSGTNVILTWPTNATSFTLQSKTNPTSTNWNTVSPAPVAVNGQNTVTNAISGTQKFYRLSQ